MPGRILRSTSLSGVGISGSSAACVCNAVRQQNKRVSMMVFMEWANDAYNDPGSATAARRRGNWNRSAMQLLATWFGRETSFRLLVFEIHSFAMILLRLVDFGRTRCARCRCVDASGIELPVCSGLKLRTIACFFSDRLVKHRHYDHGNDEIGKAMAHVSIRR